MITDKTDICNEFNNFFVSIGSDLSCKIKMEGNPLSYVSSCLSSIRLPIFTESDVIHVIASLNNNNS